MPRPLHVFAIASTSLLLIAGAVAQPADDDPAIMQAPLNLMAFFKITRVGADGTIVLGPVETLPPQLRQQLGTYFAEGFYVLVTTNPQHLDRHRVLRVQVTDIASESVFTLKSGPQAVGRVQINDLATLVRPAPTTTAGLRALPDEILLQRSTTDEVAEIDARETSARARSINNLKQIGLAMHNFHDAFNEFPPAVYFGPDGKPWHSWRVLLLPFLEHADLYNAYDFSQPWDSPKNKALIDKMPDVYRDPINGDAKESHAHYAALVGPTAIFRPDGAKQVDAKNFVLGKGGMGMVNITDGTSNTVMITSVEPGRKIPWTKPEDIDAGPGFKGFGQPGGIAAPYTFRGPGGGKAAPVLFADGSVRLIGASINPRSLEALITCQSGEVISLDTFPTESQPANLEMRILKIRIHDRKVSATIEDSRSARQLAPTPAPAVRKAVR